MLTLRENDLYYFDALAAERPIRFIEKHLCHYEDRYAGKPFLLLDWEKKIIRDLFGWKKRADGLRRFRELFLLTAKGSGKSPLITAIALYIFFADPQQGQTIFSIAADYEQAKKITFDFAKKMIEQSPLLKSRVRVLDREIHYAARNNQWAVQSGEAGGKQGYRPNVLLLDELHEHRNRKLYDNVTSNLFKRSEPLVLVATNAGERQTTICYELYQRAKRVLDGASKDDTLYPVIFEAPRDADWSLESTWRMANPSLGETATVESLRIEWIKAKENPAQEAKFRRLYLSQWVQSANTWIDMASWDRCCVPFEGSKKKLPLYIGLDLSVSDDLSSVSAVWLADKKWIADNWTYVPRFSATKYQDQLAIPFDDWAERKYIRLLDQQTVDDDALKRIEKFIVKLSKKYNLIAVGYDRARASALIRSVQTPFLSQLRNIVSRPISHLF